METNYLTKKEALKFINHCYENSIFIYGAERFKIDQDKIIPDLSGIIDCSSLINNDYKASAIALIKFIESYDDDEYQLFTIVY